MGIIITIYLITLFVNFLYFNKKDYKRIEKDGFADIVLFIFCSPIMLLFNISKYGLYNKSKIYGGNFEWGDYVETIDGKVGIYLTNGYFLEKGKMLSDFVGDNNLKHKIGGEFKKELSLYKEALQLKKQSDELIRKSKKTIFNNY